jgi:hypothetical protein
MFSSSIPYKFSSEILKMQKINHDQPTLNLFLWFFRLWTYKFWFLRTSFNFWGLETESQSKLRFLDGVFHTCDKVRISERENSYNNHDHGNILYIREHYFVLKKLNLVFFISFENVFEKLNSLCSVAWFDDCMHYYVVSFATIKNISCFLWINNSNDKQLFV